MKKVFVFILFVSMLFSCNKKTGSANYLAVINTPLDSELNISENHLDSVVNILFVGNSLTYTNNLPELIKQKALEKGITISAKMIAKPNYAIVDHWEEGDVQQHIESQTFDFVIIQQGPSSQSEGRDMLIKGGEKYAELCSVNNVKLCYFMVWPSLTYYHTFDGVIKNYKDAAIINNAILCPVGKVWKTHLDTTSNFDYYGPDGFHPSLKGSKVAADVIFDSLFPK